MSPGAAIMSGVATGAVTRSECDGCGGVLGADAAAVEWDDGTTDVFCQACISALHQSPPVGSDVEGLPMVTVDELRARMAKALERCRYYGGSTTQEGMAAFHDWLMARNDLVDRGAICDRCESNVTDGKCVQCGEEARAVLP